jgi:hypothetical protein
VRLERRPRHLLSVAAAGLVALVAGLLTAPSASADIRTFSDVGAHITSVRVSHGPRTVGIIAYDADFHFDTYYKFWVDTNSSDPGPEYKVEIYPGSDVLHVMRVANFRSGGRKFDCTGLQGFTETFHDSYVKVIVPRSCIGTPARVRVAVVGYYNENPDVVDWAPGEQRFYSWVNR